MGRRAMGEASDGGPSDGRGSERDGCPSTTGGCGLWGSERWESARDGVPSAMGGRTTGPERWGGERRSTMKKFEIVSNGISRIQIKSEHVEYFKLSL